MQKRRFRAVTSCGFPPSPISNGCSSCANRPTCSCARRPTTCASRRSCACRFGNWTTGFPSTCATGCRSPSCAHRSSSCVHRSLSCANGSSTCAHRSTCAKCRLFCAIERRFCANWRLICASRRPCGQCRTTCGSPTTCGFPTTCANQCGTANRLSPCGCRPASCHGLLHQQLPWRHLRPSPFRPRRRYRDRRSCRRLRSPCVPYLLQGHGRSQHARQDRSASPTPTAGGGNRRHPGTRHGVSA